MDKKREKTEGKNGRIVTSRDNELEAKTTVDKCNYLSECTSSDLITSLQNFCNIRVIITCSRFDRSTGSEYTS